MRIFDFTLMNGYEFSGVDVAQGFRARLFKKNNIESKFIFINLPTQRDINMYLEQGIDRRQMLSRNLFIAGHRDMSLCISKDQWLNKEKKILDFDSLEEFDNRVVLKKQNDKVAELICDENSFVIHVDYYKNNVLYLRNFYLDCLAYSELYMFQKHEYKQKNKLERILFWDKTGKIAYEEIFIDDKEYYQFENGELLDSQKLTERFIKNLMLDENDICIMDRAGYLEFIRPLFEHKSKSKLVAVLHSDQYYDLYEDEGSLYMNYEYYYWFKYSRYIDAFVVATEEQKEALTGKLQEYDCYVPYIDVIPPGALPDLDTDNIGNRKPGSIISASRLSERKNIDTLIMSVAKAHKHNESIFLDIYGSGNDDYTYYLKSLVDELCANEFIHFMGKHNLKKIYPNYEEFASFSLWETFGLSLMEAVGAGLAMVGLDVRYGNRLFIEPDKNGYLVDFDLRNDLVDKNKLSDRAADYILKIFEDCERLDMFHDRSYYIAKSYLEPIIEEKWLKFFDNLSD